MSKDVSPDNSQPISRTEIETAVRYYWDCATSKRAQDQQACYSDDALIFSSSSRRLEPGRLVLLRRQREYLSTLASTRVQLGEIDVQPIGNDGAIAAYTLQFHADRKDTGPSAASRPAEEHLNNARATQVFVRTHGGALKIVHEHLSIPDGQVDASGSRTLPNQQP